MVAYRCYILDAEDHIVQAHDLDCETDDQAEVAAQGLLTEDPYHRSVEVWKSTRRIVKLERDPSQRQDLLVSAAHSGRGLRSVV